MRVLVHSTRFLVLASAVSLAACGGGGSGEDGSLIGLPPGDGSGGGGGGGNNTAAPLLALGTGEGASFQEGAITLTSPTISAGGRTTLRLNLVDKNDGNARFLTNTPVTITSNCVGNNRAVITNSVSPGNPIESSGGVITALYEAKGCSGTDTITARLASGATATITLDIIPPELGGIQFHEYGSHYLSIAGAGTSTSPSETPVSFQVVDAQGNPAEGVRVIFDLDTERGNQSAYYEEDRATLKKEKEPDPNSTSDNPHWWADTDANGIASTVLRAGRVSMIAKVLAYMTLEDGTKVFAESNAISINTNVPYASSFSLSASKHVIDAWSHDNQTVQVTISAADLVGNPVRDGTTVRFETNGGRIEPNCVIADGTCTVTWTSQNPRPPQGRLQVWARTLGENSFIDANQNRLFDDGETIFDDINRNGIQDLGEPVINDFFKGASCAFPAREPNNGHCSARAELTEISPLLMVDGSSVKVTVLSGNIVLNGKDDSEEICARVQDLHGNQAPPGTVITAATSAGSIDSGTPASITVPEYGLVGLESAMSPPLYCWSVKGADQPAKGLFTVTANIPAPTNLIVKSSPISVEIP